MRKRRAILYDDEPIVQDIFRTFFQSRGYEVMTFREPVPCPLYQSGEHCSRRDPCGDVVIVDHRLPKMNGAALLLEQHRNGCKLTARNKALVSGFVEREHLMAIGSIGAAFHQKPVNFRKFALWLDECEQRMDLSRPLGIKRRELRIPCSFEVRYGAAGKAPDRKGLSVNKSSSGLCIRTDAPPPFGQQIAILSAAEGLVRTASVRWVAEEGPHAYLVGLHFNA